MTSQVDLIFRVVSIIAMIVAFQVGVAQWSLEQEAKRRWQHALTGHLLVQASYILPFSACVGALFIASVGLWGLCKYQYAQYKENFGPLLRPDELIPGALPGAFYFLVGALCTVLIVPMNTARYAVECLAFADPVAAWVGKSVKTPMISRSASLAGSMACLFIAWIVGYMFLEHASFSRITLGAIACMVAEACGWGNDNLSIPLLTAIVVQFMWLPDFLD